MVDDRMREIRPVPDFVYQNLGLGWFGAIEQEYLVDELLGVTEAEVKAYSEACSRLYKLYEEAADWVVREQRWAEAGIPDNMVELIERSWAEKHRHLHLYGRFDLTGLINGRPAKLIEFNADTATVLPETALIQREQLKENGLASALQFNHLLESLTRQFQLLLKRNPDRHASLLISTLGYIEDRLNADLIAQAAEAAGFIQVQQLDLEHVIFSPEEGVFSQMGEDQFLQYDFFCKLIPWEFLAFEEPELLGILTELVRDDRLLILNPPYTMLYQSKAMLELLWERNPDHELLLKTSRSTTDFRGEAYVEKVIYGREGENVRIVGPNGITLAANGGDFGDFPPIYQAYAPLPQDEEGGHYQAGVYFTGEPCALSFRRRDGLIVDEDAEFVGHFIMSDE